MAPVPLRLLVIASDLLARTGLASLLSTAPEIEAVSHAEPTRDITELLDVYQPQVVLWDMGWNPDSDLEILADLIQPDGTLGPSNELTQDGVPLAVLAASESDARALWDAGARVILLRSTPLPRLIAALSAAAQGLIVVDDPLLTLFARVPPAEDPPLDEPLTAREKEVLQLLAQGMANKAIARTLAISEHTVKFHVNAILTKLGAQSRTEAVVRASRAGLVIL